MTKSLVIILAFISTLRLSAQDKSLPYYEMPDAPARFSAGTVAARVIDGLGFRFYWATEGLRQQDLEYKPGNDTRTSLETIQHIFEMSAMVVNATTKTPNIMQDNKPKVSFEEMRKQTLVNLKTASDILKKASDEEMNSMKAIFKRGENISEYPFWNHLNGPIADCLWHVGQIVSFRRASGNPFTDRVSVFTGKVLR